VDRLTPRGLARLSARQDGLLVGVEGLGERCRQDDALVPAELARAVAEASRFPSREAKPPPMRRPPRIHRTGRTMQFNARAKPETVEALYAIADRQGWLVGETLEHALAALQCELAKG
jgi:hypothetical protein